MKSIFFLFVATLSVLLGCADENRNAVQYDFVHKIHILTEELLDMRVSWVLGKGKGGGLPPEDLDKQIDKKKETLSNLLENPPYAEDWSASIIGLRREDASIVISATFGNTMYLMTIDEPDAKRIAENLREGDKIIFTGRLMSEGSLTPLGAFFSPHFPVYPTELTRGDRTLSQKE